MWCSALIGRRDTKLGRQARGARSVRVAVCGRGLYHQQRHTQLGDTEHFAPVEFLSAPT
jgi:hypothetical protein